MHTSDHKKPLARSLGEFFGHILKGVRTNPSRRVVRKTVERSEKDNLILRRTTIEEVEVKQKSS